MNWTVAVERRYCLSRAVLRSDSAGQRKWGQPGGGGTGDGGGAPASAGEADEGVRGGLGREERELRRSDIAAAVNRELRIYLEEKGLPLADVEGAVDVVLEVALGRPDGADIVQP